MSSANYLSSDDSALLRSVLSRYSGETCLEIGAGNGGGLAVLAESFGLVVGTDLIRPSTPEKNDRVQVVLADSATCFRDMSFELVAFNPPYVPSDALEDRATDGGKGGIAVTLRFLNEALRVIRRGGKVVFLLSSDNHLPPVEQLCDREGLTMRLLASKKLFFETLSVYEITKGSVTE